MLALIRLALASPARVAMVQAQDVLGLGSEARMNMPGEIGKAWKWSGAGCADEGPGEAPQVRNRSIRAASLARRYT